MSGAPSPSLAAFADIAWQAGQIVLRHYMRETIPLRRKTDHSPVTDADEEAERFILAELKHFAPDVPVIAEEEMAAGRRQAVDRHFFLVDPLDGTKEFIDRNGEFTINIAEIEGGRPVRGVVYAPARDRLFLGDAQIGAFEIATQPGERPKMASARSIRARAAPPDGLIAVASRSHRDSQTDEYLARFRVKGFVSAGSSLKFCLVAAGEADIYPRHGRTMEWDTAAGQAVLEAAGGSVRTLDGRPFVYGKAEEGFANPFFVARGA